MNAQRTALLLAPLALSCALGPAAAQEAADAGGLVVPDTERTIRFGDAEEHAYTREFFPGADHDPALRTPDELLGQRHGTRLAHHAEVLGAFRAWAEASDRMTLETFGHTHEGRELVLAVITSPENHARLDEIRAGIARLADPRGLDDGEARDLVESSPAIAWMGYSIHGDELSGTDASMAVAHHLVASRSPEVAALLDELVVLVDPCLNPDGRERMIGMVEQSAGYTPNLDHASMHRGRWPYGRGNHYLFDMNRDWMAGTQPETRARWRVGLSWHPQLFVDAHEMGSLDTFLFYPQAEPLNPEFTSKHVEWQSRFADDAARAFDAQGWSYYTREWADGWGPFYSDAWGSLTGAIGILYEQARTAGFQLRRASGEVLTYREAVHHQATASLANLETLRANRAEVLTDYLAARRENVSSETPGNEEWLAVRFDDNPSRMAALMRVLAGQGIEYDFLVGEQLLVAARSARGEELEEVDLPAGTLVARARQPERRLLRAYLGLDPRMPYSVLKSEREDLEREGSSRMYDVTAWSLAEAFDLDAWWGEMPGFEGTAADFTPPPGEGGPAWMESRPALDSAGVADDAAYAWVVDGSDDASILFAARAMELGLSVHAASRSFGIGEASFARGSLLVRRGEHELPLAELEGRIERAASEAGTSARRLSTGRAPGSGPDLGGGNFELLTRPRIAVVSNSPVSTADYGHLWHHLDVRLGVPFTILDAQQLGRADLRRYNVLLLPPGSLGGILEEHEEDLEAWMRSGGTLIATGSSAYTLTAGRLGLSGVHLRRDALDELDVFARAVLRERAAHEVTIDEAAVWEGTEPVVASPAEAEEEPEPDAPLEERDAWMRRFMPSGVHLLAEADQEHWLTGGAGERLAVLYGSSRVLLAREPAQTPVRLRPAEELRLGGLLWPEARERLADAAYLTREGRGDGQLILFAELPTFRGYQLGTARLLSNALILGPGLGASAPVGW